MLPFPVTAVVFGGSGFIGRHIIQRLAHQGINIRVPTRDPQKAGFLKVNGKVGQIVPLPCDIQDDAVVAAMVSKADIVINLLGTFRTKDFQRIHVDAAERIAKACQNAGVKRLVHISALGADLQSPALFGKTKALGEKAVLKAFPQATIVRPSVVFGPEDNFFNRFARLALISPALPLIGGGQTRFQPVYVGDVADAVERLLTLPATRGSTYELGGPQVYTFHALMEIMLKTIHRRRFLIKLPFGLAKMQAWFLELLPSPPLTRDQVDMLKKDNVTSAGAKTFSDIGLTPKALEVIIPIYLDRFRPGGRFAEGSS